MYSTYSAPCVSLAIASKKRMASGTRRGKNSVSNNTGCFVILAGECAAETRALRGGDRNEFTADCWAQNLKQNLQRKF